MYYNRVKIKKNLKHSTLNNEYFLYISNCFYIPQKKCLCTYKNIDQQRQSHTNMISEKTANFNFILFYIEHIKYKRIMKNIKE